MDLVFQVTTIAGNGEKSFEDGNALDAMFDYPTGICISKDGRLYVTDQNNDRIRMIYNDEVTTIAGNGRAGFQDGNALESQFLQPSSICISNDGKLYVTDTLNSMIRMISDDQVTRIAVESMFRFPKGICISNDGKIYVSDYGNHRIVMIYDNQVTTIAGNGQPGFKNGKALEAMFNSPTGICISNDGKMYISDHYNHRIRMMHKNKVTTVAGNGHPGFKDGIAPNSMFNCPIGICTSRDGRVYVADNNNHKIRMIYKNQVTTIAGMGVCGFQDGNGLEAMLYYPTGICCSEDGKLYVADYDNHRIRMIYSKQLTASLTKSPFGFALLLDMQNVFCDHQISIHGVAYHIHSAFVRLRCPLLFDQDYLSLIEKANISNKSFDSFVNFLYSNSLTKEYNQILHTTMSMPIESVIEMIFLFDLLMNCKSILVELKTRFEDELIEMMKNNQQESVRKMMVELLPYMYNMKEMIKTKPNRSTMTANNYYSYTEYCYNVLINELRKKRSIFEEDLSNLQQTIPDDVFTKITTEIISKKPDVIKTIDDQSMIAFGVELKDLSKLAFESTNFYKKEKIKSESESATSRTDLNESQLQLSTQYLNEWTKPDFVIKLSNDDISYHVHKLILCGRWKYFCLMIESGLKEVNENQMTLSDDWNKSRFEKFMKYIYLNEIEFDKLEDIIWLMENRKLYGLSVLKEIDDIDSKSENNDQSAKNEIDDEMAAYGFEELYEHCVSLSGRLRS